MKHFNLCPVDGRKSFYGKATVTENNGCAVLRSYNTDVAMIDAGGTFHRFWDGESATTTRHINAFCALYGVDGGGLAWWREQPIERFDWISFYAGALA